MKKNEEMFNTMRTAILTAYPKIFTDIEYSSDIFFQTIQLANSYGFSFKPELFVANMSIEIESRYKAVNKALDKHIKNPNETLVIEIATGLSPRKLQYSNISFIECDLQPLIELKKQLYKRMNYSDSAKNLHSVDLSNQKELEAFLTHIPNLAKYKKVIVISEGLFWYLKKEDIENMAKAFSSAFGDGDWVWISSDCPPQFKNSQEYRNVISNSANIKRGSIFPCLDDFYNFFNTLGFSISQYSLTDLISPKNISSGKFFSYTEDEIKNKMVSYTDIAVIKKNN